MYTRVAGLSVRLAVLGFLLGVTSCGGDDDGGGGSSTLTKPCVPGMQSVPNSNDDPCPQNTPQCPSMPGNYTGEQAACSATGCDAITTCQMDMTWNTTCNCFPRGGAQQPGQAGNSGGVAGMNGGAAGSPMGPACGNGVVQAGEQCEPGAAMADTCMSLGMGSGTLMCDPSTCMFDTSMCGGTGMAGSGGAGG